jgi:hypothetical protein
MYGRSGQSTHICAVGHLNATSGSACARRCWSVRKIPDIHILKHTEIQFTYFLLSAWCVYRLLNLLHLIKSHLCVLLLKHLEHTDPRHISRTSDSLKILALIRRKHISEQLLNCCITWIHSKHLHPVTIYSRQPSSLQNPYLAAAIT